MPRYIRGDLVRALGVPSRPLLPILRRGVHVILSDVDAVWLHDPNPMVRGMRPGFEDFAHADMIVSTDCHNPESDSMNAGCFGDLLDKNTGVMCACRLQHGNPSTLPRDKSRPPFRRPLVRHPATRACRRRYVRRRQTASRRWQSGGRLAVGRRTSRTTLHGPRRWERARASLGLRRPKEVRTAPPN